MIMSVFRPTLLIFVAVAFAAPLFAYAEPRDGSACNVPGSGEIGQLLNGTCVPRASYPSGGGSGAPVTLINPLNSGGCSSNSNCLESFLVSILNFVVRIGAIVVILMLVYIGFKFVTAQGREGEITKVKEMLLWTVVGSLILLGAKVIAMGIQATVQSLGV